jgi:hypothetical protein
MSKKDDGGQAFPLGANEYGGHGSSGGMTLRDYFAAKYMAAHVAGWLANDNDYPNRENVAAYAYLQADAMLKERDR